jgi:hypothetical protein
VAQVPSRAGEPRTFIFPRYSHLIRLDFHFRLYILYIPALSSQKALKDVLKDLVRSHSNYTPLATVYDCLRFGKVRPTTYPYNVVVDHLFSIHHPRCLRLIPYAPLFSCRWARKLTERSKQARTAYSGTWEMQMRRTEAGLCVAAQQATRYTQQCFPQQKGWVALHMVRKVAPLYGPGSRLGSHP